METIKLLTVERVAEIFSVTKQAIRMWTWDGRIPHVRLGRAVRYNAEVINKIARDGLPERAKRKAQ